MSEILAHLGLCDIMCLLHSLIMLRVATALLNLHARSSLVGYDPVTSTTVFFKNISDDQLRYTPLALQQPQIRDEAWRGRTSISALKNTQFGLMKLLDPILKYIAVVFESV